MDTPNNGPFSGYMELIREMADHRLKTRSGNCHPGFDQVIDGLQSLSKDLLSNRETEGLVIQSAYSRPAGANDFVTAVFFSGSANDSTAAVDAFTSRGLAETGVLAQLIMDEGKSPDQAALKALIEDSMLKTQQQYIKSVLSNIESTTGKELSELEAEIIKASVNKAMLDAKSNFEIEMP